MTTVTITTLHCDRRHSGVLSTYTVHVRGHLGVHRNPSYWQDRGSYATLREADIAADRAAAEPGAVAVEIREINAPSGMPVIMDAAQDYGVPDGWSQSTQRDMTPPYEP